MMKNYFKRSMLLLAAATMVSAAYAEKTYVDVTRQYIKDAAFIPGWQGVVGNCKEGVGQVYDGAFKCYQNLGEMPAGHYVLTANALYRCGNNDYAKANQAGNADLNTCYIFINDAKTTVKGLWEGRESAPNSREEANAAFQAGEYLNTVEFDHNGGNLEIGICNTGCYWQEWACFDNFVLTCDGVKVDAIINGDFEEGTNAKRAWDNANKGGSEKTPDIEKDGDGMGGANFRKCGGTEYNTGQRVELPAGTYRFSMTCFHRYGSTMDENGQLYRHKWPLAETEAYGAASRSPKDWFEANDYDTFNADQEANYDEENDPEGVGPIVYAHAYIYATTQENKPRNLEKLDADQKVRVKDVWEIWNGDLASMPDNNPRFGPKVWEDENGKHEDWPDKSVPYETKNKCTSHNDSGNERESGAAFLADPEKYRQGIEFTLEETAQVWLGWGKDSNTGDGYWHPYGYITLEKVVDGAEGIESAVAEDNAVVPVEYYTISGVRTLNPSNGIYIVKQGNKVSKRVIR